MKSTGSAGRHLPIGMRLDAIPSQNHLMQVLGSAEKTTDRYFWLSWPALPEGSRFALSVIINTPQQRRGWQLDKKLNLAEPEWCLHKEVDADARELWTVQTGDIVLLQGLISSECTGVPQESREQQSSTGGMWLGKTDGTDERRTASAHDPYAASSNRELQSQTSGGFGAPERDRFQSSGAAAIDQAQANQLLLSGNLKELDLPSVMQSVNLCKMTGRLNLTDHRTQIEVYFSDGELVHAQSGHPLQETPTDIGDRVILDLFTWDEGTFQFQHGWKTNEKTIKRRMHALLLEGAALRDYQDALTKKKVTLASTLARHPECANITEADFDAKMKKEGLPVEVELQKRLFVTLATPTTLEQLLKDNPMPRSVWVPVIFNLVSLNFIAASGGDTLEDGDVANYASVDDLIAGAQRTLIQPDSSMHAYPFFLLNARNEFARLKSGGSPFAICMLEFNAGSVALSNDALIKMASCFDRAKRPFDVLSFAMPNHLYILLPQCDGPAASKLVQRFMLSLSNTELDSHIHGSTLGTRGGIALVPQEGDDLKKVLAKVSAMRRNASSDNRLIMSQPAAQ